MKSTSKEIGHRSDMSIYRFGSRSNYLSPTPSEVHKNQLRFDRSKDTYMISCLY